MIRISRIEPYGKKTDPIPIRDIRQEFYNRLHTKGRMKINSVLTRSIKKGMLIDLSLDPYKKDFLKFLEEHYKAILIGDLNSLNKILNQIIDKNWQILVYDNGTTDFGKKLITTFGYENRFRSEQERGIWLAKQLNIKSCPYCNSQYTLFVEDKDAEGKAIFQFDHFFPKSIYPYFSVSLFNLIPSCANCNHDKSGNDVSLAQNYHPYYHSLSTFAEFILDYPPDIEKLSFKELINMDYENDLKIEFKHKYADIEDFVEKHNKDFNIESIYKRHKDHAHELLVRARINNEYYQDGTMEIKGLFPDNKTMMRYILGNYMEEKDILKRPLAKFYQDIAKQLNLIK